MTGPAAFDGPNLHALLALFPASDDIHRYDIVAAEQVPIPYHGLLVHEHHMTVTVEAYHRDRVNVQVLRRHHEDNIYARKILLTLAGSGRVVQYGIVRVDLSCCSPEVAAEIVAARAPFGRILIEHNVMRRIEPTTFLRIVPGTAMRGWFGLTKPEPTYGRLAYIHCDDKPAVELLEIVVPEDSSIRAR
ncbi:MAG: hypothetical protein ACK4RK_01180 [Gemmataceae bacterium]